MDINGEEHPSHPCHRLRHQVAPGPYKCNGCKLPGIGPCHKCEYDVCDFYLHEGCFQAEYAIIRNHKFMEGCTFRYHASPPRVANRYCDACGLDILGFRYECLDHPENPHDLHPTCVGIIDFEEKFGGLKFKLCKKDESKCHECKQRYPTEECIGFTGWKWVSKERYYGFPYCFSGKKTCLHVKCLNKIKCHATEEKEFDECEMYRK